MKTKTKTSPQKKRPRIHITVEVLKQLEAEFKVAGNTVRWALKFFSDSTTSKAIRRRAMELMAETVTRNTEFINEYDQD